jgi:hypothetical protein
MSSDIIEPPTVDAVLMIGTENQSRATLPAGQGFSSNRFPLTRNHGAGRIVVKLIYGESWLSL